MERSRCMSLVTGAGPPQLISNGNRMCYFTTAWRAEESSSLKLLTLPAGNTHAHAEESPCHANRAGGTAPWRTCRARPEGDAVAAVLCVCGEVQRALLSCVLREPRVRADAGQRWRHEEGFGV